MGPSPRSSRKGRALAHEIPTTEPTELIAGNSWQWDRVVDGHSPADGWSLTYFLRGAATHTIPTTSEAGVFRVRRTGAQTQVISPGQYELTGRVEHAGERFPIFRGLVVVAPDPATAGLSFAERMCAKIEAELEARFGAGAGTNVRRWQQGARAEELAEEKELRRELGYYREQVRVERGGPVFVPVEGYFGPR
jgi:hypothetical protein